MEERLNNSLAKLEHLDQCLDEYKEQQEKREQKADRMWRALVILAIFVPFFAGNGKWSLKEIIELLSNLAK